MSATAAPPAAPSAAQPVTGGNSQPTPEQELLQIERDLKAAEQLASDVEAKYGDYKAAEKQALEEIYDVWKTKEHRVDLLKPFCDRYQIPWDARMEGNRFLPVLMKMFPKTDSTKRSYYSGALAYAWEQKTPTSQLDTFFKTNGGIQKTYRTYTQVQKQRQAASQAAASSGVPSPMLDNLHQAMQLMLALTYRVKASEKGEAKLLRHFVIRNETSSSGNIQGVVETAVAEYTAPASRMTFDDPFQELQGVAYVITDAQAETFVRLYPHHKPWAIAADVSGIIFEAANGSKIKGVALGAQHEGLRVLDRLRDATERMVTTAEQIMGFRTWYDSVTAKAKEQYRRMLDQALTSENVLERLHATRFTTHANPFSTVFIPRALDFNVHADHVTFGFNRSRLRFNSTWLINVVHDMFSTSQSVDVLRERRLLTNHARKLFGCLTNNPAADGAMFYLASTDEAQGAFVCELPLDAGEFIVAYPTVLNAEMQQRCILDDIDIGRLANTGVVIPAQPQ